MSIPDIDPGSFQAALSAAQDRQRAWVDAKIREVAPALATVPDDVRKWLGNVQKMLAATNHREAARYATEVAREAPMLAHMRLEWAELAAKVTAMAPLDVRIPVKVQP